MNQYQREVADLIHNSHPTKKFIDERIYAANIWSVLNRSEVKAYEKKKQTENYERSASLWRDDETKRAHERLQKQAFEFWQAQDERFRRLANGPDSFPLDKTIEAIDLEYPRSSHDAKTDQLLESLGLEKYSQEASRIRSILTSCNLHLQTLKKREACEMVLWNNPLPETLAEISFFENEKLLGKNCSRWP